jgi:integrase
MDGIGESKKDSRQRGDSFDSRGVKQVSNMVHSGEYKDEVIKTISSLARFAKREFGVKDIEFISLEIIREWVMEKVDDGVMYRSISTYLGHINKLHDALVSYHDVTKKEYKNILFKKIEIERLRKEVKDIANSHLKVNRAYVDPYKIVSLLRAECYIAGRLQLEHGLRVKEATLIKEQQLGENKVLDIRGKGGRKLKVELSSDLYNRLKAALRKNRGFIKIDYGVYTKELKEAVLNCNEKWQGTHALRYNFAQREFRSRMQTLEYSSFLNTEGEFNHHLFKEKEIGIKKDISNLMGHNRYYITNGYL